jgi:hypothetical protein
MRKSKCLCNIGMIILLHLFSCSIYLVSCSNAKIKSKIRSENSNSAKNHKVSSLSEFRTNFYLNQHVSASDNFMGKYVSTLKNSDLSIESMASSFTFDANSGSNCDVQVIDRIKFKYPNPTLKVEHMIISKKMPLYGFKVSSRELDVQISNINIFQDTSFQQRFFVDENNNFLSFRDRFLVTAELSKAVTEIELEFEYNMQRAILIDNNTQLNNLKAMMINPYHFDLENYRIIINLLNFRNIDLNYLKIPAESSLRSYTEKRGRGIQISQVRKFNTHAEFEMTVSLPMEIYTCEGNIVNLVFYGLLGISIIFVIMSIWTFARLYKE